MKKTHEVYDSLLVSGLMSVLITLYFFLFFFDLVVL